MDINQLVSFVDYQLGQKQGWEALSQVLHEVKKAKESVATAKAIVKDYEKEVESMKASLVELGKTAKAKEADLVKHLDSVTKSHQDASRKAQVALEKGLAEKLAESARLDKTLLNQTALAEKLALEINELQADKIIAENALNAIRKQLVEIKEKL